MQDLASFLLALSDLQAEYDEWEEYITSMDPPRRRRGRRPKATTTSSSSSSSARAGNKSSSSSGSSSSSASGGSRRPQAGAQQPTSGRGTRRSAPSNDDQVVFTTFDLNDLQTAAVLEAFGMEDLELVMEILDSNTDMW